MKMNKTQEFINYCVVLHMKMNWSQNILKIFGGHSLPILSFCKNNFFSINLTFASTKKKFFKVIWTDVLINNFVFKRRFTLCIFSGFHDDSKLKTFNSKYREKRPHTSGFNRLLSNAGRNQIEAVRQPLSQPTRSNAK